jgi:glycogen operon protein
VTIKKVKIDAKAIKTGNPYPLGATWDGEGVNFALFSEQAEAVELCFFDSVNSRHESQHIFLPAYTDNVWHAYIQGINPGQLYGYRVHGIWDPKAGNCFNPNKVLLDPYAKAIARVENWEGNGKYTIYAYTLPNIAEGSALTSKGIAAIVPLEDADLIMDPNDDAAYVPLAAVVDDAFDWEGIQSPAKSQHESIIYEAHVKGLTLLHPDIPEDSRGTYAGMSSQPIIDHLKKIGITAIELLPIQAHLNDPFLVEQGKKNYWGYNTMAFFAPELRYASKKAQQDPQGSVIEFKTMVKAFHQAGIEVILDVVYNHTCEGNHLGPMISMRGIDNLAYYKHMEEKRFFKDFTGCGNTLNVHHPRVLQLIMDSLRYWVQEMHIDGFRFDLAPVLGRDHDHMDPGAGFFDIIRQDPTLRGVKLIAEPWDLGMDGYQLGRFPAPWCEWNGHYRDTIRRFWKGDRDLTGEFATRVCGSSDYFHYRQPFHSINFICCHDGFTLEDLVSYNEKHNDANGEDNRDGENHNLSWNCGVEGHTKNNTILSLRRRQKRNMLATLLLSLGVPMLNAGDEMGRTQNGNNNAYCQDNELGWVNWNLSHFDQNLLDFVSKVTHIRKNNVVFQRRHFLSGKHVPEPSSGLSRGELAVSEYVPQTEMKDSIWFGASGHEMTSRDWLPGTWMSVALFMNGQALMERDEDNRPIIGNSFLLVLNATDRNVTFHLPKIKITGIWERLIDTSFESGEAPDGENNNFNSQGSYPLQARSLVVLKLHEKHHATRKHS